MSRLSVEGRLAASFGMERTSNIDYLRIDGNISASGEKA